MIVTVPTIIHHIISILVGNPLPNQPVGFRPEDKEVLLNEVPGAGGPRSAEEERDQTALQNLLLRIERLSQRMEEEVDAPTLNQQTSENWKSEHWVGIDDIPIFPMSHGQAVVVMN